MNNLKKIIISHKLFNGFNEIVNVSEFSSFKDLILYIQNKLISQLTILNLNILIEEAKLLKLHNHEYKFYSELLNDFNTNIIYLCDHKCENNF
jgi:hypothetical protein